MIARTGDGGEEEEEEGRSLPLEAALQDLAGLLVCSSNAPDLEQARMEIPKVG